MRTSLRRPFGRLFVRFAIFCLLVVGASPAWAQLTGTKNIPGDYADLTTAIGDLNTQGVGAGGVTLNVLAANPQTTPAGGYSIATTTASVANPVTVACNGNTITAFTPQASGSFTDAIFKIVGTDNVTISGCTMLENAANTTTAAATNNMTEFGVALFYATTTDGSQNATIQGNTIDLDRTYANTFGVYSNSTHSATAVTTLASATSPAGANSGLRVFSNNITDVNYGVVSIGPTAAADFNDLVDIGGAGAGTGNTFTNFGTTDAISAFAGFPVPPALTVAGVWVRNTRNFNVSFNGITSSVGGMAATGATLRGVYVPTFSAAPTGTITNTINNNTFSLRSGLAAGAVQGVTVEATTANATTSVSVNNNVFTNSSHTVAASGAFTFINMAANPLTATINGNQFNSLSLNTTGSVTFITRAGNMISGASESVSNNAIGTSFAKTGAGGTLTFFAANASSVNGSSMVNNNNNFSNVTVTGATAITAWSNTEGASTTVAPTKTVTGNTFSNITGGTSAITVMSLNFGAATTVSNNTISGITGAGTITGINHGTSNGQGTHTYSGNTITSLASTGGAVVGITGGSAAVPSMNITGNTISTLSTTAAGSTVQGIVVAAGAIVNVSANKIFDLANTGATTITAVNGILMSAGATVNTFNNLIGDLRTPAGNGADTIRGLSVTSTTASTSYNLSFNTVLLNGSSTGAAFGSSGVFHSTSATATTAALALRNNIVVNLSTPVGTGRTVAYRRSSATLNNFAATSNNNDYFAGTPGASNLIFFDGTNSDQTIATYRTRVASRDSAAISENPTFTSTSGPSPGFLHINTSVPTQLESGGLAVAGITTDFDADTRNATTPDIGADEFNGVLLDLVGPSISYTPLAQTVSTANRVLAVTIIDAGGVASGGNAPRIYFRRNAAAYVSTACTGAAPNFSCTIDNALLGGVVVGDAISYFVVAQDNAGNLSANPSAGFTGTSVNNVTSPPTTPFAYNIVTGAVTSIDVGPGGAFPSLTNVGGAFEGLNNNVLVANVTINITGDLVAETGAVALNQLVEEGAGAGTYTVTIKPATLARVISGAGTPNLIKLNGADRVTIDGSLSGGTDRSLTVTNTNAAAGTSTIWLASTVSGNGANGNTLRNLIVNGASGSTTLGAIISSGSALGAVAEGPNSGNGFFNNQVAAAQFGIALVGPTTLDSNNVIAGNVVGSAVAANKPIQVGIAVFQQGAAQVSSNTVTGVVTSTTGTTSGIRVSGGANGITISGNRISDIKNTNSGGFGANGIQLNSSNPAANVTVSNNFIWDVAGFGFAGSAVGDNGYGIILVTGGAYNIWSNSVNLNTNQTLTTGTPSVLNIASAVVAPVSVRNNNLVNSQTVGVRFAIFNVGTAAVFSQIGNNDYFAQNVGSQAGVVQTTLANWQTATPLDTGSIAADPLYVSPIDLHLQGLASPAAGAGAPIASVTIDIDGDARPPNPDIGADEIVGPNATPTISAVGVSRHEGDPATSATIANVNDFEDAENALTVTVNGAASATVNSVTVSGISTSAAGVVTANVGAACGATTASFTLRVTDSATAFAESTLNVTVVPNVAPTLSYPATTNAVFGQSLSVSPASGPTDDFAVTSIVVQSPGSYTGGATVNSGGVVSLTGAQPVGTHTIVIRASDACAFTDANLSLTVAKANTTTTITSNSPNPSTAGQPVVVNYTVAPVAPGAGTPTGNVTVTDGVNNCTGTVATGTCTITLTTSGTRTLVATYVGDGNFNGSVSPGVTQLVDVANTAPTITAVGVTRRAGDASANSTIANVNDAEDAETALVVTVNGAASATVNNVTVSGISTTAAGVTSANVVAACGATTAAFTLRVTDSGTLFNQATLNVTVNPNLPPTLTYPATTNAVFGQNLTVNPATGPTDTGTVNTIAVQSNGTYTGTSAVNNGTGVVTLTGAQPVGTHTIVIRATDNCLTPTDANLSLVVGQAATTTTVTSDLPDPSNAGQNVVVQYTVVANPPGSGTPTGNVTVSDGVNNCTGTVAAGQCTVAFVTPGNRTITATYAGDTNFATSSDTEAHIVNAATDLSITKTSNLSQAASGLIQYTVVARNNGPLAVTGATVIDNIPVIVTGATWTCTGTGSGTCTANGSGSINQLVNLPVNATVTFAITGNIPTDPLPGTIVNTATITAPAGITDTNAANNSSTVTDVIVIFRNGFEDGPGNAPLVSLDSPTAGQQFARPVPLGDVLTAARDATPSDVALFKVGDALVLVSARRISGEAQVSVLVRDATGWHAGPWVSVLPQQLVSLVWSRDGTGQLKAGVQVD